MLAEEVGGKGRWREEELVRAGREREGKRGRGYADRPIFYLGHRMGQASARNGHFEGTP